MSWVEVSKNEVSRDANGVKFARRHFRIWDASPNQLLSNPSSILGGPDPLAPIGLPNYNDEYPDDHTLRLDRYDTSANGLVFDAQAYYSSDRRFRYPSPTVAQGESFSVTWKSEDAEIPFAVKTRTTLSGVPDAMGAPTASVVVEGWDFKKQKVLETQTRFSKNVNLTGNIADAVQEITEQNNKLMLIGNKWYRFEAGDIPTTARDPVETRYSFIYDPGTTRYSLPPGANLSNLSLPPDNIEIPDMYPGVGFTRPPFHVLLVAARTDVSPPSPFDAPFLLYYVQRLYTISSSNGLGWQRLPDIGNLF